jgi:hypothetical protein
MSTEIVIDTGNATGNADEAERRRRAALVAARGTLKALTVTVLLVAIGTVLYYVW